HRVTLFNRGRHNPDLFPDVERLHGDRAGDLALLRGRSWDAAVDTSGHLPHIIEASADALSAVGHYTFISSVFAYRDYPRREGIDESAPTAGPPERMPERITPETLGVVKAACERVIGDAFAGRALILRPGFIFGPYDATGRSSYWVDRIAEGGDILAP